MSALTIHWIMLKLCSKPGQVFFNAEATASSFVLAKIINLHYAGDTSTLTLIHCTKAADCILHLGPCLQSTEWSKLQIQSSTTPSLKMKKILTPPLFSFFPVSTFKTLKKMALIDCHVLSSVITLVADAVHPKSRAGWLTGFSVAGEIKGN